MKFVFLNGGETVFRFILIILLSIHFGILCFYLLPDNPIKHQYKKEITDYVNPLFSQSWNLFAPNPINTNISIHLRFKVDNINKKDTTIWVDIIEPIVKQKQQSFWSPVQRILKNMSTITQSIAQTQIELRSFVQKQDTIKNKDAAFVKLYNKSILQCPGHIALLQYSNYVFDKMSPNVLHDSVSVSYKIVYQEFPRFSKRNLNYFDKKNSKYSEFESKFYKIR